MSAIAGVDGCRGGWIAAIEDLASGTMTTAFARRWRDLPSDLALICVDMPIGLAERGGRGCDRLARALLPAGRKSSIFAVPRRPMLDFESWEEANDWGRRAEGCGIARQAWHLAPKIREIDSAIGPADQTRVRETHPELVFQRLNGATGLPAKRTRAGREVRLNLLAGQGLVGVDALFARHPRAAARPDDVLDACACLLTARRALRGEAVRLATADARDRRGLRMEIWY